MRKAILFGAATATLALVHSAPSGARSPGATNDGRELGYFLPRTRVAASVQQQLLRCPEGDQPPLVETRLEIVDKLAPDPAGYVRLDGSSGFLSGRTTKLALRQNGTLSGFNATTQGEGGKVLSAVIGAAATVASAGVGLPLVPVIAETSPVLRCKAATRQLLDRYRKVEAEIQALQSNVAEGKETPATGLSLIGLRAELDDLKGNLTLTSPEPVLFDVNPADFESASAASVVRHIEKIDYSPWFDNAHLAAGKIIGFHGFQASLTPNRPLLDILKHGDGASLPAPKETTPYLLYRRPVLAAVTVEPCDGPATGGKCQADSSPQGSAASDKKAVLLPQLSGLFHLPIGRGGLFGTRQAAATFDEQGAPLTLEYGSTSGGADIAGVIDSGTGAFTTYRGAETTEMNRRTANLKARKELEELLADQ